ncbi:MAG: sigma 54-interacting transcriptional regulator [Planctomycetaceae bacterium]|nr:sigma 54-interacting transcriptional regulator [Planctomycetaceae bacterium]
MPQRRPKRGLAVWMTSTSLPVFVLDERRVVLVFNRGCEEWTGWEAADVIGKTCELIAEVDPQRVETVTGLLAPPPEVYAGQSCAVAVPLLDRQGQLRDGVVHFFPLGTTPGDDRYRVLGVVTPGASSLESPTFEKDLSAATHSRLAEALRANQQRYSAPFVGHGPAMQRVLARVGLAQQSQVSVHLHGATGTGKEFLSRQIHYRTAQRSRPFVPVDCRLTHAELQRVLERAFEFRDPEFQPGALCLKHVEALPRDLQVWLRDELRQEGAHPRMYSTSTVGLDVEVRDDRFDADLAVLLTTLTLDLPTLSDRREDIVLLAQQMLESFNRRQARQVAGFAADVQQAFKRYHWPGHLRELEDVVHAAWRRSENSQISMQDLPWTFQAHLDASVVPPVAQFPDLDEYLASMERGLLEDVMRAADGNKTLASTWLNIPRPKLYRRLVALGLLSTDKDDSIEEASDSGELTE